MLGYTAIDEAVFSMSSTSSNGRNKVFCDQLLGYTTVLTNEAGLNTSTVTLRVIGGDKRGSLKSETVKYGREPQGTWTPERLRWQGPASYVKDRPVLSSERVPHESKTVTVKQ
jgi:hypothetical protein